MEKTLSSTVSAVLACLWLTSFVTFAQAPAGKAFGKANPFQSVELPAGILKSQLQALPPQEKERAMKWLHTFDFGASDAAKHLRTDKDGGVFIVCPINGCGDNCGHDHDGDAKSLKPTDGAGAVETTNVFTENMPIGDGSNDTFNPTASVPFGAPPAFHSKPGAPYHIYLDFNGAYVTGKAWSSDDGSMTWDCEAWSTDSDKTTFSVSEQNDIRRMWERIAEDYAPFNVNVTTDAAYDPDNYTGDKNKVGWLLTTPTRDKNGAKCPHFGYGGIAYVNVFGLSNYFSRFQPAWVTPMGTANTAEAASHEMGHNMGLSHDGTNSGDTYYEGHDATTSAPSWGPIMGASYNRNVSQWSTGEYFGGNEPQDDLAIIAGKVSYRDDDHGDTNEMATVWTESPVKQTGVVENTSDPDVFTFTTAPGTVTFKASSYRCDTQTWGANLAIALELYDASQNLVASSYSLADTNASISTSVPAGTYYLVLKPAAAGSPLSPTPSGFSIYGSLGYYSISGTYNHLPSNAIVVGTTNGCERIFPASTYQVTWKANLKGNVKIDLLRAGRFHSTIAAEVPNNGFFPWLVDAKIKGDREYRLQISSLNNPIPTSDVSDANFFIDDSTFPLGNEMPYGWHHPNGGVAQWAVTRSVVYEGKASLMSLNPGDGKAAKIGYRANFRAGNVSFFMKTSSERGYDFGRFYVDGVAQEISVGGTKKLGLSGDVDWTFMSFPVSAGNHILEWRFEKDDSLGDLQDRVWIDAVGLPPTSQEIAVTNSSGMVFVSGEKTINFPETVIRSSSKPKVFTIQNRGKADLVGLRISRSGANAGDFVVSNLEREVLAPGESMNFAVVFAPKESGLRKGRIRIHSNDDSTPKFIVHLEGTARGLPLIGVNQPSTNKLKDAGGTRMFGPAVVGSEGSTRKFTIINRGSAPLTQLDITKSGIHRKDFIIRDLKVTSLAPGASTTFKVTFNPLARDSRKARIHISSNDKQSGLFDIALQGTGVPRSRASAPALAGFSTEGGIVEAVFGGNDHTTALAKPAVTSIEVIQGQKYRALTVPKEPGVEAGTVQVSPNLLDWFSGTRHTTTLVDDSSILKVRDNTPITPDARRYIRLK